MNNEVSLKINNILKLAAELDFPIEVLNMLKHVVTESLLLQCASESALLTNVQTAFSAYKSIEEKLKPIDNNGFAMLAVYLDAANLTKKIYSQIGIDCNIFIQTMGCFTRFINELKAKSGQYVFDRGFWAWRQLSGRIFRLGALEFEYRLVLETDALPPNIKVNDPVLSVHIPSDAVFSHDALQSAYSKASAFFKTYSEQFCHSGAPKAIVCGTWLLSQELKPLLKPDSGILRFAKDYKIYFSNLDGDSVYTWLFNDKRPPQPLSQDTSLQRSVAVHLQNGGKIGEAYGVLSI